MTNDELLTGQRIDKDGSFYRAVSDQPVSSQGDSVELSATIGRIVCEFGRGDGANNPTDSEVRPDPFDGGCPQDSPDYEHWINKVRKQSQSWTPELEAKCVARAEYIARVDECIGNSKMLTDMGHFDAARLLVARAEALTARAGL